MTAHDAIGCGGCGRNITSYFYFISPIVLEHLRVHSRPLLHQQRLSHSLAHFISLPLGAPTAQQRFVSCATRQRF